MSITVGSYYIIKINAEKSALLPQIVMNNRDDENEAVEVYQQHSDDASSDDGESPLRLGSLIPYDAPSSDDRESPLRQGAAMPSHAASSDDEQCPLNWELWCVMMECVL